MNIKPFNDRVVVRQLEAETTNKMRIINPDVAAQKTAPLEVVPIGREFFVKCSASAIVFERELLRVIEESNILAIVETCREQEIAA